MSQIAFSFPQLVSCILEPTLSLFYGKVTSIVYQETQTPTDRTESATLSEEVKYFTAYPSLALSSPADSSLDSATLKDLPTTERIAVSLTQPPPPPVRLHQPAGIIKTSTTATTTASSDVEEDSTGNISETPGQQFMQTGNYS